jgi:allantoicase
MANDSIIVNGREVVNPLNQEVVTLRGIAPGEYTVNAHYYESKDGKPVDVTVSVVKVNPRAEVVYYGTVGLARKGDEATAVRFTVLPDGAVEGINTLPKTIVQRM